MSQVPLLLTWDIDPNPHFYPIQKRQALRTAFELCQELEIPATFFFTARESPIYSEELDKIKQAGHEISCHGLTHGDEEEYDHMPEDMQRSYIEQATDLLGNVAGCSITAFRGPRVKVSSVTLKLLAEHSYLTDSSVCSQRIDIVSSNFINVGWLMAPRLPYHPHRDNAFKQGNLDILEIPISALILPFISSTLYTLKLVTMKALFRALYAEAHLRGKPIVYLAHPEEFGPQIWEPFSWSDLSFTKLRTHGLMLRKHLNERNPEIRLKLNRELLSFITTFPDICFMTMQEYAQWSRGKP